MIAYLTAGLLTLSILTAHKMIQYFESEDTNARLLYNVFTLITIFGIGTGITLFDLFILT